MKPVRIQRQRTKGFKLPPNTMSVTRPFKWGNYSGDDSHPAYAAAAYRHDLVRGLAGRERNLGIAEARKDLKGKNLACFCPIGSPCHADVLLELACTPVTENERGWT